MSQISGFVPPTNVRYSNVSKVTENVYQFQNVSFVHGAICVNETVVSKTSKFPELYYYKTQNRFWVPMSNAAIPDQIIDRW